MPSRLIRRRTSLAAHATLLALVVTAPLFAQELQLPSEPLSAPSGGTLSKPSTMSPSGGPMALSPNLSGNPGMDAIPMHAGPASAFAAGSVYNPTLGAHLRARYNTRSYGQQKGTLDLGTMKMMDWDGGMLFLDGQVTMNDESHVGYNLGLGYRWMTLPVFPFSPDDEKIMGVSIWSDGQTVGGDNFFNQIGVSLEMLGEHIDFRANGYAPVGPRTRTRDGIETGELTYSGNSLAQQLQLIRDTALTIGEAEVAGRLGDLDAWAFAGVYGLNGGQYDAVGGQVGLRGYATPDLLLSIAVANDDEFDTNALFSATWFIGRTRAENCPTGQLRDRMREPVIRHDYIATQQDSVLVAGDAILQADGTEFRVVHVDSTAAAGGDGTFENPLNSLDDINTNSLDDDIVLAHGGSDFNSQTAMLRDGQTFFGEGAGNTFSVDLLDIGTVSLPETAPGALDGPVATIDGGAGAGVVLADNNTVQNLAFDGGLNAITNDAVNGSFNSNLNNLTISGTTGDGIALTAVAGADEFDANADNDTDEIVNLLGAVTIDEIAFNNVGGNDIDINADASAATVNVGETINISNITTSGAAEQSIAIRNTNEVTHAGTIDGDTTISDLTYSGGTTANGALLFDQTDGQVTVRDSDLDGGSSPAIEVSQTTGGVSVANTVTIDDVVGEAVLIDRVAGDSSSTVAMNATITNANQNGGGIRIVDNTAVVNVGSNIQTQNAAAVTITDSKANITFSGDIDSNGTGDAITITNAGVGTSSVADVTFSGTVNNENDALLVVDGGDNTVAFTGDVSDTTGATDIVDTGEGIRITGRDANAEVRFESTASVSLTGATDAIVLGGAGADVNDDDSGVTFAGGLAIAGATRGITGTNGGELNITTADGIENTLVSSDTAIRLTGGSSADGVNFTSVTGGGGNGSVVLDEFDGTLDIDDGQLTSTAGTAVQITDSGLDLDGVDIVSSTGTAIQALFNGTTNRVVSIANANVNADNVIFTTSGTASNAGDGIVTLSDITNLNGADFNATGRGNLLATMTDITGTGVGNTTLDVTNSGNGSLTMTNAETGGTVTANSSNTSSGDLSLTMSNSGSTTPFDAITVNDQGDGAATANLTNITSTAGVAFDSTDDGNASLIVNGGDYGAGINASADNNGNFTASVIGNTTLTAGNVVIDAQNTGTLNATLTGVDTPGTLSVTAGNTVTNANININGGSNTGVTVDADNTGTLTTNVDNITTTGALSINATNDDNTTIGISGGGYDDGIAVNANNTGTIDFSMTGVGFDTNDNLTAVDLDFGSSISSGTIDLNDNDTIETLGGNALDVSIASDNVIFQLRNTTLINDDAALSAATVLVSGSADVDATFSGNTFQNLDANGPVEFLIATAVGGSPTLNLNIETNNAISSGGGAGSGEFAVTEGSGTVNVFELDATFDGTRNQGTFNPDNRGDFDNLLVAPATP